MSTTAQHHSYQFSHCHCVSGRYWKDASVKGKHSVPYQQAAGRCSERCSCVAPRQGCNRGV